MGIAFESDTQIIISYLEPIDERRWSKKILKVYKAQLFLEKNKHMKPHFSESLDSLVEVIK